MIRFQRIGRTNDAAFRIVVVEKARAAKTGRIVERVGSYNPHNKEMTLNEDSVKGWLAQGAQPTDSIRNLFITKGVLEGKKVNVLPKKTPIAKEVEAEETKPETSATEAVPETENPSTVEKEQKEESPAPVEVAQADEEKKPVETAP